MIVGFDHVVIGVRDIEAARIASAALFGAAIPTATEEHGFACCVIALGNISVELLSPIGASDAAQRLRAAIDDGGEGLKSLVFASGDIEALHRRLERVALAPEAIQTNAAGRRSFRANTERTHGARLFFMERAPFATTARQADAVSALDHIVIRTPDVERAASLYGARLGLDMRLDRKVADSRLMFFRCGDAIVEIVETPEQARDQLWGLSWRVGDADAARARLAGAGLNVSDVRDGMKPGTRVFTVRDGAFGIPTLMIEARPRRD